MLTSALKRALCLLHKCCDFGPLTRIPSMTNNKDEINIYEVDALLFQIISYMPEAERRELQSVLIDKQPEIENRKNLSLLISSLSEAERRRLLRKLVNWYHSKSIELREYPRKSFPIPVEHSNNGVSFVYFIHNISNGGVFIRIDGNFHIAQKIILTFSLSTVEKGIKVSGRVVRVDSQGIGLKFDELINAKAISKSFASKTQVLDKSIRP